MAAWLARYIDSPDALPQVTDGDEWRVDQAVWSVGGWAVATDSRAIVAVRGPGGVDPAGRLSDVKAKTIRNYLSWQSPPGTPFSTTTLAALWQFLGPRRQRCPACDDGHGLSVPCDDCGGGGFVLAADPRPVRIAGVLLDADMFVWHLPPELADLGDDPARLTGRTLPRRNLIDVLVIDGPGWRVVQAGLEESLYPGSHPAFRSDPAFAALWSAAVWAIENYGDELPGLLLADWLDERGDSFGAVIRADPGGWVRGLAKSPNRTTGGV